VLTAWQNDQPDYGSLHQMASDLSEISAIDVPVDIEPASQLSNPSSATAVPSNTQPATSGLCQPVSTDNTDAAGDSTLDAEAQRRLDNMLRELTLGISDNRQSALSEVGRMLDVFAIDAVSTNPGTGFIISARFHTHTSSSCFVLVCVFHCVSGTSQTHPDYFSAHIPVLSSLHLFVSLSLFLIVSLSLSVCLSLSLLFLSSLVYLGMFCQV
jgi:hypothetical protein